MEFFPAANVLLRLVGVATAATVIPVEQIPGTRNDKLLTVWIVHGCGVVVSSEADCTMYSVHYVCTVYVLNIMILIALIFICCDHVSLVSTSTS